MKQHKPECFSGTEPWNKCFCKEKKEQIFICNLCDWSGIEHGLKTHKRMVHPMTHNKQEKV